MVPISLIELNDGAVMPQIGYGTSYITTPEPVVSALRAGYRLIDTAKRYENEEVVGEAIAASEVAREDIFVVTKVPGRDQGHDATIASLEGSLERLGLDRVDLYLIHWPLPHRDHYVDTWRAMIELRDRGLTRSIGVSNFLPVHTTRLIHETGVVPAVNQVELHPWFSQADQRAFDGRHDIVTQAWFPLGRGHGLLDEPTITEIAARHTVSPAQVVLRWHTQLGSAPIPRSSNPQHLAENLDVMGFTLDQGELSAIGELDTGRRLAGDPATHEEF